MGYAIIKYDKRVRLCVHLLNQILVTEGATIAKFGIGAAGPIECSRSLGRSRKFKYMYLSFMSVLSVTPNRSICPRDKKSQALCKPLALTDHHIIPYISLLVSSG